ncbi:diaminopimelate decarboxylase [Mycobacteroides abscessus subsp. bolletii]|nr:diaminopimelate decarboxylase [Mycobacteroides abscessus subsp. bolletii]SLD80226.1 diaminopimelate decarboxylase [Mycobacteroides abscessus subsp. bolletii]SLD87347.1 diaminopimelate decarboxylase [Mycobacteroides abscessus subsp. bolletii]
MDQDQQRRWSRRAFVRGAIAGGGLAAGVGTGVLAGCTAAPAPVRIPLVDGRVFVDTSGSETAVGGKPISWWVQRFGLPLNFVYGPTLTANIEAFKSVFTRRYWNGEIRFAAKAEPHPVVLKVVAKTGAGVDAASSFEAQAALDAGIPPDKIDVNGNAKDDDFIELAISKKMLMIVDSVAELHAVAARAGARRPRVLLRVSGYYLGAVTDSSIFTAGVWTKFGIPITEIASIISQLHTLPVDVVGFHTHIGSQITSVEPYRVVLAKMLELGHQLRQAGHELEILNIGGGFPVSYLDELAWNSVLGRIREGYVAAKNGDSSKIYTWENKLTDFIFDKRGAPTGWRGETFYAPLPKEQLLEKLLTGTVSVNGTILNAVNALKAAGMPRLLIEPGRSIAAEAGTTFSQVRFLKTLANGHNVVSLDTNSRFLEGDSLNPHRWRFAKDPHRNDASPFETFIAGNLCFSGDMLTPLKVPLARKPQIGDILMTSETGAYNTTFSAANTNSFPRPPRIFIDGDGTVEELRQRDTYQQIYSL